MPVARAYFEIHDVRPMKGRPWTTLREITKSEISPPEAGIVSLEQWSGTGTAAVENRHRKLAEKLQWSAGLGVDAHRSGVESWGYRSSEVLRDWKTQMGVNLVIDQYVEETGQSFWHLHPDLLIALDLVREGDSWFRPVEGWVEVVRLGHDADEKPRLIEIRTEFLLDYLAARDMGLYCSSYHERVMVGETKPNFSWPDDAWQEASARDRREGIITEARWPDPSDCYWTRGALWRTEWLDGGTSSTRIRGDADPHSTTFASKADGTRAAGSQLDGTMAWLHFDPAVVLALLRHRGGRLRWATQETGVLGATDDGVHFGVNHLGRITVFAKDIGRLASWEQRIWSAHNVTPDGDVSRELFAAQMEVNPAATIAPERNLRAALSGIDNAFQAKHGRPLMREDDSVESLLKRAHRFVAIDDEGLLELAKELTRLFMERVDVDAIGTVITFPKNEKKLGSLKALEKLISHHRDGSVASSMMAPLFGIYDLRLADAHLGSSKIESGKARASIVITDPFVMQGRQLIQAFVSALHQITAVLA